jgi:hypothetical protein
MRFIREVACLCAPKGPHLEAEHRQLIGEFL